MSKWGIGFEALGLGRPLQSASDSNPTPQIDNAVSLRRKILKWAAICLGGLVLLLAVLLIAFRIVLSRAPEYRAQVQSWVSDRTGLDIQFERMDARWRFYGPELVFDSAVVRSRDGKRTLVNARRVSLGFDVWTAISTFRLVAGRLTLEQPELQVFRTPDGRIELVGQGDLPELDPNVPFKPDDLPTGRLSVVNAKVSFRDFVTGRGPWVVPGVSFDFARSGRSMHLEGEAELPANFGRSLRFIADTAGRLESAGALQWKFTIDARDWDLAGWRQFTPRDWPAPLSGHGSVKLAGVFTGTEVSELSAQLLFKDVELDLPRWHIPIPEPAKLEAFVDPTIPVTTPALADNLASNEVPSVTETTNSVGASNTIVAPRTRERYARIGFDLQLMRSHNDNGDTWHVNGKDIELARANVPWRRSTLAVTVNRSAAGKFSVNAQSELLVLENLWPLLAYIPESQSLANVRALNATGRISEMQFDMDRATTNEPLAFSLRARFSGLGVQAIAKAPGFANFSGVIEGNDGGGKLELNVRGGSFDMPRSFRTPLPLDKLAGTIQWHHDAAGWHIDTNELLIDNADGHARANGGVLLPADGSSAQANVTAQGWDLVARAAPRYMPANKLSPKSLEWLDRAFTAGSVQKADFELRGPLQYFPFRGKEGLFLIKAHIVGLTLDYQPGWVPGSDLTIDAEFRNEGMAATILNGDVNGLPIVSATGRFVDFKESVFELRAQVQGGLGPALSFVQKIPVGPAIGKQFMDLRGEGLLQGQVELTLPLHNLDDQKLTVNAQIGNGLIGSTATTQVVRELKGTLQVRDHALYAIDLNGKFLDGPVNIKGGVEGRYTGRGAGLLINAQGRASGPVIAQFAGLPASIRLNGGMQWRFTAHSPRHAPDDPAQITYRVESDTKGLGVELPEPLGKSADVARPLQFDVDASRDNELLVRGIYGDARALVRLQKDESGWRLDRGGVRVDAIAPALPAHTGLRIEGAIERFVLDDWLKLTGDQTGKQSIATYLRAANVRIGSFGFLGFNWSAVRGIVQISDEAWRIDIAGDDIAGQVSIPLQLDTGAPLQIALSKLNVGVQEQTNPNNTSRPDPRGVPAITGRVDELTLSGRRAGVARFALEKVPQGVKLVSSELRGDSFTATLRGSWLATTPSASRSSMVLDLASTDVRDTLRAFGFRDLSTAKHANAHAALTWSGGIDDDLLSRASGSVKVEMLDGQLLNVDPGSAGRMLGLMSITALPRRLSLDFSDVTDKGISFDKVSADFELREGNAYTNNLFLTGPQAEVGIVGRTGLANRDYDLTAVAAGDIGGSLSVASTVVGGPVVGAAVLAFTSLFKQPLKGVTRRYYHIGGPWDNPAIERIDKVIAKQDTAEADAAVSESHKENTATEVPTENPASPNLTEPEVK